MIGYVRLLLLALALGVGTRLPHLTYWLMLITMLLDGLDGIAARRLNQASWDFAANRELLITNFNTSVPVVCSVHHLGHVLMFSLTT